MIRFGSLFSGIGGFDLGFERAGLECAWQVEIDKDCQRVLKRAWPNVQRFDDVTTVREFEPVDLICGGFPCQDLSVAGKRAGLAGERSGLWFEFLRIIESNLPRWVVIENVPGLLSSASGTDFRIILNGLVNVGYCVGWRVFDAQYFGVAQRRRRVFIVGSLGNGSCAEILFESESMSWNPPTRREAGERVAQVSVRRAQTSSNGRGVRTDGSTGTLDGTGGDAVIAATLDQRGRGPTDSVMMNLQVARPLAFGQIMNHYDESQQTYITHALSSEGADASEDGTGRGTPLVVADCLTRNYGKQPDSSDRNAGPVNLVAFHENKSGQLTEADVLGIRSGASHSYQGVGGNFGVRRLTPRECERLQGFPDDWTLYDAEGKTISDSARYRMLGNAVEVDCAEWIGKRILAKR